MVKTVVSMAPEERCQEHVKTDGEVTRSKKTEGMVERIRKCKKCGSLFKTFEMTDDELARRQVIQEVRIMELQKELRYYQEVVENIKALYEAERTLKVALKGEYEFRSEDGGLDGI